MAEHPNVEAVRRAYEAFAKNDLDTVRDLYADDAVLHFGGGSDLAGDYRGWDEILGVFMRMVERTGGNFGEVVHDVVGNDEHVLVMGEISGGRPDGRTLMTRAIDVHHMSPEGKVTESWTFWEDQAAFDAFIS